MKSNPKVTIGVLCYNEEKNLRAFFKSISKQTYKNLEIIVSDNKSNDNSKKILYEIKKKNPKIKLNFFEKNTGVWNNLLQILEMSSADYIVFASPGDILHKKFIEECMKIHLKKNICGVMSSIEVRSKKKGEVKLFNFQDVKNFNNLSAFQQANFIRSFSSKIRNIKLNYFLLGILKRSVLINIKRSLECKRIPIEGDRLLLYHICMSGKLYHLNKNLYIKNADEKTKFSEKFVNPIDQNEIIFSLKSIFFINNISRVVKLKFSLFIFKIIFFKITNLCNLLFFYFWKRVKFLNLKK